MHQNIILNNYTINRKMPKNYVEGELDFCKTQFSYETYDVKLVQVNNCLVDRNGFIFNNSFSVNKISLLLESRYKDYFTLKYYVNNLLVTKKRTLDNNKNYLLVHDEWSTAHYHWFCDLLPRLYIIKESLKNYVLLLPDSAYIKDVGLKSLEFFDLHPSYVEFICDKELLKVKNLTVVTHTCLVGQTNDKIIEKMRDHVVKKLNFKNDEGSKLYITRDKANYRKVLNEDIVANVLKNFNYEIIRYEDCSFSEQIVHTSLAKSIVSIHGAGLTNMFFMRPEGTILEFRRNKIYHNQCFWHLSQALNLNYYYLFGRPDKEDIVLEGNGCNLTIDSKLLEKTLITMEANSIKGK